MGAQNVKLWEHRLRSFRHSIAFIYRNRFILNHFLTGFLDMIGVECADKITLTHANKINIMS